MRWFALAILSSWAADAWAGDKGACRKARREHSLDGWTGYVLDHPDGVCRDEAMGQLLVLGLGRVVNGLTGDPTKVALAMAQLGHMSDADFAQFRELMGGLGGLGGLGGGLGGLGGGLGGLGEGGWGEQDLGGVFGGTLGDDGAGMLGILGQGGDFGAGGFGGSVGAADDQIYVGFSVVSTAGGWNSDAFYTVLDDARFGLQACWNDKGIPLAAVTYDAEFGLASGKPSVKGVKMTYSGDGQPHPDAEACVKQELGKLTFPAEYTGAYTYRVDFY